MDFNEDGLGMGLNRPYTPTRSASITHQLAKPNDLMSELEINATPSKSLYHERLTIPNAPKLGPGVAGLNSFSTQNTDQENIIDPLLVSQKLRSYRFNSRHSSRSYTDRSQTDRMSLNNSSSSIRKKVKSSIFYHPKRTLAISLIAIILCILALGVLTGGYISTQTFIYGQHFVLIIDAGSTSSKLSVFKWEDFPFRQHGYVNQVSNSAKVKGGISDYLDQPSQAFENMKSSLTHIVSGTIPETLRKSSNVYLAATAGMRLAEIKSPEKSKILFQTLASDLEKKFELKLRSPERDVRLLSGEEEGIYGWITANYVSKAFGDNPAHKPLPPLDTTGALDMGGASTQITFVLEPEVASQIPNLVIEKNLFKQKYLMYSRTLLCNGKSKFQIVYQQSIINEFLQQNPITNGAQTELKIPDPCRRLDHQEKKTVSFLTEIQECFTFFKGLSRETIPDQITSIEFTGTGDYNKCLKKIEKLMIDRGLTECDEKWCYENGQRQPKARGKFYAFAGFYWLIDFLKKTYSLEKDSVNLEEFRSYTQRLCQDKTIPNNDGYLCLDGVYFEVLFRYYGLDTNSKWQQIEFVKDIGGTDISWALGFAIDASGLIPGSMPNVYVNMPVLFGVCIPIGLLTMCLFAIICLVLCNKDSKFFEKTVYMSDDPEIQRSNSDYANQPNILSDKVVKDYNHKDRAHHSQYDLPL